MPSRSSRARAVLILVIGLCALALPIASVPTVAAAMVRCCCGEHDASDDCGCKDCPAGHRGGPLAPGTVARIFTGAALPDGADAVVMQEDARIVDAGVAFAQPPEPGHWVRRTAKPRRA